MRAFEIVFDIIINAGIAHGFLISIFFLKQKNRTSHFLLSLLLIDLSLSVFGIQYLTLEKIGSPGLLASPFMFLLGPLSLFYLRGIVVPGTLIDRKDLGHFVIFIAFIVLTSPLYLMKYLTSYSDTVQYIVGTPWVFLILQAQLAYYLIQTHRLLHVHQKNIINKFSNVEGMDASWLKLVTWVFVLVFVFIMIAAPWLIHGTDLSTFRTTSAIFFSLICFFIAYKGIQQKIPVELIQSGENAAAISNSESMRSLKEKLLLHMETSRPFLNPELTLVDLSKQLGVGRNQLSLVINSGVGDNFYYFINKFRVEEVKTLIKKDARRQYTILALANDAGFNSKSSFNSIFKKMTGLTPSEYRDAQK